MLLHLKLVKCARAPSLGGVLPCRNNRWVGVDNELPEVGYGPVAGVVGLLVTRRQGTILIAIGII